MQYAVTSMVMRHADLETALKGIAAQGFSQVEILCETPHFAPGEIDPDYLKTLLAGFGLTVRSGHGPYNAVDCASLNEQERTISVAKIASSFAGLVSIGAEYVVVHPNQYSKHFAQENYQASVNQTRKSISELAEHARTAGIKLAVENLPHHGTNRPMHSMEELTELIANLPDHVGLCLDTTHACISHHDPLEQLNIAADRLFVLHLHDTDGQGDCHWVPGKGIIQWNPFISRLAAMKFAGARTIEVVATAATSKEILTDSYQIARQWEEQFACTSS